MTNKEARTAIYSELAAVLDGTAFRLREDGFVRKIPGGSQEIGVPFYDYNPRFDFSLVMTIRLDAVEKMVHAIMQTPSRYQAMTVTTIVQVKYFTGERMRFRVTSTEEIKDAIAGLAPLIRDEIVPFLDEHQDVLALDRWMNCDAGPTDTSNQPGRAMSSLLVAKLAGNPDFDRLVAKYRSEMEGTVAPVRESYERCVEYIKLNMQ